LVGVDEGVEEEEDAPEEGPLLVEEAEEEPVAVATGSHPPLEDGSQPDGFPIKGNADSMKYHVPGTASYERTKAEVWFATVEDAEAAGYVAPRGNGNHKKAEQAN
jgi:large subunit ribosomal protein L17